MQFHRRLRATKRRPRKDRQIQIDRRRGVVHPRASTKNPGAGPARSMASGAIADLSTIELITTQQQLDALKGATAVAAKYRAPGK